MDVRGFGNKLFIYVGEISLYDKLVFYPEHQRKIQVILTTVSGHFNITSLKKKETENIEPKTGSNQNS